MNCPKCKSPEVIKAGKAIRHGGLFPRFQCKNCGHVWATEKQEVKSDAR